MTASRLKLALAAVALVLLAVAGFVFPVREQMLAMIDWLHSLGSAGPLLFGGIYIVATVGMLPGALLTLGAGFAYGPFLGAAIVLPASVVGALLAFLLARSSFRPWLEGRMTKLPRLSAIDHGIKKDGFKVVVLLRLTPLVPFALLNYALGMTGVQARTFVGASTVGMLPGVLMYTYIGSLVPALSKLGTGDGGGSAQQVAFWVGLAATVIVSVVLATVAKRSLAKQAA